MIGPERLWTRFPPEQIRKLGEGIDASLSQLKGRTLDVKS
jgi:hypothetical protein